MAIRGVQADLFLADRSEWLWLSLKQEADAQTSSHWWLSIYLYRVVPKKGTFFIFIFTRDHQVPQLQMYESECEWLWLSLKQEADAQTSSQQLNW